MYGESKYAQMIHGYGVLYLQCICVRISALLLTSASIPKLSRLASGAIAPKSSRLRFILFSSHRFQTGMKRSPQNHLTSGSSRIVS
jgi:hypothetical protein